MPEPLFFNEVNNNRHQPGILLKKTGVLRWILCIFKNTFLYRTRPAAVSACTHWTVFVHKCTIYCIFKIEIIPNMSYISFTTF